MTATVSITGVLFKVTSTYTRQGLPWAHGEIAADGNRVEVLVFPNEYETYGPLLTLGAELTFTGRLDETGDMPRLTVEKVEATR